MRMSGSCDDDIVWERGESGEGSEGGVGGDE